MCARINTPTVRQLEDLECVSTVVRALLLHHDKPVVLEALEMLVRRWAFFISATPCEHEPLLLEKLRENLPEGHPVLSAVAGPLPVKPPPAPMR
mgnify:FL=1